VLFAVVDDVADTDHEPDIHPAGVLGDPLGLLIEDVGV
jgi:hypothetical protein